MIIAKSWHKGDYFYLLLLPPSGHIMYNSFMQSDQNGGDPQQPSTGFVFHPGDSPTVPQEQVSTNPPVSPLTGQPAATHQPVLTPEQTNLPPQPSNSKSSPEDEDISWTASEFIAHQKSFGWYLGLGLAAASLAVVVYILTRDKVSSVMIIIVACVFGVFALKKPRVLQYIVDDRGITIGQKHYSFSLFKSFSVVEDGAAHSLILMPLQRFMPTISVYYSVGDEQKILVKIADFLPFEEHAQDFVDRIMRKIRF